MLGERRIPSPKAEMDMTPYTNLRVNEVAKDMILAGFEPKEIVETVRRLIPESKISAKNVSYYKWALKKEKSNKEKQL